MEINGVAHVIFRVNRIADCIAFYDQLMPFLGLKAVQPRSDDFVYYVGGRTALAFAAPIPNTLASRTWRPDPASTTCASGPGDAKTSTPCTRS